jgi:hypothetical protein
VHVGSNALGGGEHVLDGYGQLIDRKSHASESTGADG